MGGLLYKDFITVRGKRIIRIALTLTLLFFILRMLCARVGYVSFFAMKKEDGTVINMLDLFLSQAVALLIIMCVYLIDAWRIRIMQYDEKNKIRSYLASMPVGKNTYVAAKYVFIGICTYVLFSLSLTWNIAAMAFTENKVVLDTMMFCQILAMELFSFSILMSAIEFPLFFAFGKEKAMLFKIGFAFTLGMLAIGWFLFGDLNAMANWDVDKLVNWIDQHAFEMNLITILSPLITLILYYLSYRISVWIYERREGDYE
jgi:hypothetical protein